MYMQLLSDTVAIIIIIDTYQTLTTGFVLRVFTIVRTTVSVLTFISLCCFQSYHRPLNPTDPLFGTATIECSLSAHLGSAQQQTEGEKEGEEKAPDKGSKKLSEVQFVALQSSLLVKEVAKVMLYTVWPTVTMFYQECTLGFTYAIELNFNLLCE